MNHDDIPSAPAEGTTTRGAAGMPAVAVVALLLGLAWTMARPGIAAGFAPVMDVVASVGWLVIVTLGALGAADGVRSGLGVPADDPVERFAVASVAGSGVLVAVAGALAVAGWFRPVPLLGVLLVFAALGAVTLRRRPSPQPRVPGTVAPLVVVWAVLLVVAGTTSPFYDQWHQHLGFPWLWLREGSITTEPADLYTFMPVNSSLLYAYGLKLLGSWSAQVIHWWCGVVTVVAVAAVSRRVASDAAAVWSVWLVATVPTVLVLATTAGSDLVVTMYAAGAWLGLLHTRDDDGRELRWWAFVGVCVGLAVGTKYTALGTVALPLGVAALVLHRPWSGGRRAIGLLRGGAVGAAGALASLGPWLLRNTVVAGNPMFPFLNRPFLDSLRVDPEGALAFEAWLSGFDVSWSHLVAGLDLGVFTPPMDGFPSVGPLALAVVGLAVAALPWLRRPEAPALAAGAVAGIVFWLAGLHVCRYLLPALLPAAVVTAGALALVLDRATPVIRRSAVAGMVVLITWSLVTTPTRLGLDRLGVAVGLEAEEDVLRRWVSSFPALEVVAQLPAEARLLLVAEARPLGFERPVLFQDPYGEPYLERLAENSPSSTAMAAELADAGITHVLVNRWEMRRVAELHGRERYFAAAPGVQSRMREFARECLEPRWSAPGLALYALRPECDAEAPGGEAMAEW